MALTSGMCLHAGTAQTATGNNTALAGAGAGGPELAGALGQFVGRRLQQNIAASLGNPPTAEGCEEQRVTPTGKGGGAISEVRRSHHAHAVQMSQMQCIWTDDRVAWEMCIAEYSMQPMDAHTAFLLFSIT